MSVKSEGRYFDFLTNLLIAKIEAIRIKGDFLVNLVVSGFHDEKK